MRVLGTGAAAAYHATHSRLSADRRGACCSSRTGGGATPPPGSTSRSGISTASATRARTATGQAGTEPERPAPALPAAKSAADSSISSMIYGRGNAAYDLPPGPRACSDDARWDCCCRISSPRATTGASAFHGADGGASSRRRLLRWDVLDAFAAAAQRPASRKSDEAAGVAARDEGVRLLRGQWPACGWRRDTVRGTTRAEGCAGAPNLRQVARTRRPACCLAAPNPAAAAARCAVAAPGVLTARGLRAVRAARGVAMLTAAGSIGSPRVTCRSRASAPASCCNATGVEPRATNCRASVRTCRTACPRVPRRCSR